MTDKIEISKFDIKASQVMTWGITLLFLIVSAGIIFSSFTLNGFYVIILLLFTTIIVNYSSAKMWNIWYEEDSLIIQNIYKVHKVPINQFKKIEMKSIFNNAYTLYLSDDKEYQFKIKPSEDLVLFFKSDPQYYAKKMTQKLNELK
jgi:hypothetical protein